MMELFLSIALGLGLAAACGFRIFVPLLVMSVAVRSGHLALVPGFDWIGTEAALVSFAVATAFEIGAYYVPWLDALLDAVATPTAIVAGIVVTASVVTDLSPWLRWTLAVLAGGGVATGVQAVTVAGRQLSSWTTLGFANPLVSTAEAAGALTMAVVAVVAPLVALVLLVVLFALALQRLLFRHPPAPEAVRSAAGEVVRT